MDNDAKKTALRMIPYGLYVLTAEDGDGNVKSIGFQTETLRATVGVMAPGDYE